MAHSFYEDEDFQDMLWRESYMLYNDGHLSWDNTSLTTGIMVAPRDPDQLILELTTTASDGTHTIVRLDALAIDELIRILLTFKVAINGG